jgi:glycosyltransferase involved in cell wall biosynthesis
MVIFPSRWFEAFGRVVAKSFAMGTPVIASRLGYMPAMIDHQSSGLLFDSLSLASQVQWMLDHRDGWLRMQSRSTVRV